MLGTYDVPSAAGPLSDVTSTGLQMPNNFLTGGLGNPTEAGGIQGWLQQNGVLDNKYGQGWGAPALGLAQGLTNAFFGMKQYGLAKDIFNENKRQFALNYDAQKSLTNSQLEDRQRARVASNPGAYQSVDEYMNKNGVK